MRLFVYLFACALPGCVFPQQKFTLNTNVTIDVPTKTPTKVPIQKIVCPPKIRIPIFSLPCNSEKDCKVFGPGLACCKERCIRGVLVPNSIKSSRAIGSSTVKPSKTERPAKKSVDTSGDGSNVSNNVVAPKPKEIVEAKKMALVCPKKDNRLMLFSLPCNVNKDCDIFGKGLLCCSKKCIEGVQVPQAEMHLPALFGLVDRVCPISEPVAEIFDVQECSYDGDCTPRICCPEKDGTSSKSYCRTPAHNIEKIPGGRQLEGPIKNLVSYMQCTAPPRVDLFPKPCQSTLDCFPNLCCQENGKKYCRPPKRSIISLVADVTTRIGAAEATRKFIERITK